MKRFFTAFLGGVVALGLWTWAPQLVRVAKAGVACSVPFNLQNGTTADASQVMANFNSILSCLANNTAASGANDDITALLGLTTPIPTSAGGTTDYIGGTVTVGTPGAGIASALVIASTTPTNFVLTTGYTVKAVATAANLGATTLAVGSSAVTNFYRQTPAGPVPMVGGELAIGTAFIAQYDGTQWVQASTPALNYAPGTVFEYASTSCPAGAIAASGSQSISQTTFPTLFGLLGTTWGPATGGNFTVPDLRGRTTYGQDALVSFTGAISTTTLTVSVAGATPLGVGQTLAGSGITNGTVITALGSGTGGIGTYTVNNSQTVGSEGMTAGRITTATNFDGTVLANAGGFQGRSVAQGNLNSFNLSVSDPGHQHGLPNGGALTLSGGAGTGITSSSTGTTQSGLTNSATTGISVSTGGSGTPLATLSPGTIMLKCVKA